MKGPIVEGRGRSLLMLLVGLGAACGGNREGPLNVSQAAVVPSTYNALSAVFTASVSRASRVHVNYAAAGLPTGSTPDVETQSGVLTLPVLGLMPSTDYEMWITASAADGSTANGPSVRFRTGELPPNLSAFTVEQFGEPAPGYTMLSWSGYSGEPPQPQAQPALIVDSTGRVVWYRQLDNWVVDWQKQPDGTFTAAVEDTEIPEAGYFGNVYFQLDNLGNVLRTWRAAGGSATDEHELRLLPNGDALIMAIEERRMDLSRWGGGRDGIVVGNILQRLDPSGRLLFSWNALDRLSIDATDPLVLAQLTEDSPLDFTHANAIDVTADGHYLVSLRHLSQIIKINSQSGEIIWKLGGVDGEFAFQGDPLGGFSFQHAVRELPNGNLLLFDNGNGHHPPQSRAVEYRLDLDRRVATLAWQFNPEPHLFGFAMGFTQRLPNGNTLITYGFLPRVQEVTPEGRVVWDLQAPDNGWIYRAIRIPSLY